MIPRCRRSDDQATDEHVTVARREDVAPTKKAAPRSAAEFREETSEAEV